MYIGQEPATSFTGLIKQDFTVSATTSYTLSHSVNNANDIALYRNFVRQEPTTAYSCTGTSLTLTSATVSGDDLYCIYLGQALQTVNPANASVGNTQVASSIINGQTAETSIADADEVLIYDSSATALRKMTKANFVSGIGGANTPNFFVEDNTGQSISNDTISKLDWQTEKFDSDSAFASNKFTVPSGKAGKYFFYASWQTATSTDFNEMRIYIYKNGSSLGSNNQTDHNHYASVQISKFADLSVGDYIEVYVYHNAGSLINTLGTSQFFGYRIIE